MPSGKVAVFGVPTAAGGRAIGLERGPFALREAGLLRDLRALGPPVVNLSDLSLFPYRDDPEHAKARNAEVVACAVRATADGLRTGQSVCAADRSTPRRPRARCRGRPAPDE